MGEDAFPSCLSALSSLSLQLCAAHRQTEQMRQELAAIKKQSRLQTMKQQLMRTEPAPSAAPASAAAVTDPSESAVC
jgi:hypothetical protein